MGTVFKVAMRDEREHDAYDDEPFMEELASLDMFESIRAAPPDPKGEAVCLLNVAVAEFTHVQQVCKYSGRLDPTMTVVASPHTTRFPYAFPLSLVVTRDTVLTVCARRDADSSYL